jgi:hypothetical protein
MAAPLNSPLHSPLRSPLRSPFASKWGSEPQIRLSSMTINETAADNAVVGALTVVNLPAGITASSYAITADPDNKFAIVSTDLTIDEDVDFSTDPSHNVTIEATLSDASTLSRTFTISVLDTVAPTLSSSVPADNATGVAINANMVLTFSENIFFNYPGGGTFDLRVAGGAVVETFTPTSTSAATGSAGGTASITTTALTINPFADLTNEEEYAIRISATCLEDDAGNAYAGIANDTTLSFTAVGDAWAGIDFTTGSVPGTVTATGGANGTRINSSGVVVSASGGRLTYNPVSPFASYGILCEPARTNLLLGSAEIDSIPRTWEQAVSGSSLSVTANAAVAPDGTTTAEELAFGAIAAAGNYAVRQQDVVSASSVKTGSVWLKAKAGGDVGLKIWVYLASQNDMVAHTLTADWVRVATTGSTATTNPRAA